MLAVWISLGIFAVLMLVFLCKKCCGSGCCSCAQKEKKEGV